MIPKFEPRTFMHMPVGALTGFFIHFTPLAGAMFMVGWVVYEVIEDWRIGDRSYFDVASFLMGMAGMTLLLLFLDG